MKIFINYQLTNAFKYAVKRHKIDAIEHMVHNGMKSIEAVLFIEAMSQDLEDSWNEQKRYCLVRRSTCKQGNSAVLNGFRWYDIL